MEMWWLIEEIMYTWMEVSRLYRKGEYEEAYIVISAVHGSANLLIDHALIPQTRTRLQDLPFFTA